MKKIFLLIIDFLLFPLTILSSLWLKFIRTYIITFFHSYSPVSFYIFKKIGLFPIINHYYEPLFDRSLLKESLRNNRNLNGIDFKVSKQLDLLNKFEYQNELIELSKLPKSHLNYSFKLGPFRSGDSDILFNFIRFKKPKRIIEIGCGHSTLMIQHAIKFNKIEDPRYDCQHTCIEPYENSWLNDLDVKLISKRVEEVELELFKDLGTNDILFIDSSHILRPQGDVLFEYLEILPSLNSGVLVHIHDIFSPKDYLDEWKLNGLNFWDEQYLLEAFLSFNDHFEIVCAVNYLKHNHYEKLALKCPLLTIDREPGSFWIQKIK